MDGALMGGECRRAAGGLGGGGAECVDEEGEGLRIPARARHTVRNGGGGELRSLYGYAWRVAGPSRAGQLLNALADEHLCRRCFDEAGFESSFSATKVGSRRMCTSSEVGAS